MMAARSCCLVAALWCYFGVVALAQKPPDPDVPPGKWKWYYGLFNDVGVFAAPSIFWGSATMRKTGSEVLLEMEELPTPLNSQPVYFKGRIGAKGDVNGVFHAEGILTEEDPPIMQGRYNRVRWGKCLTETIVLGEKASPENVMVFRRGTPPGC